jgi:hypothetical protein
MKAGSYLAASGSALCRLVIPGANNWRPGVPIAKCAGDKTLLNLMTYAPFVDWPLMPEVSFLNTAMPSVEFLSQIANTDHVVELTLQKIA